jgi:MoaA/NifB/PqqE/SkfB family radical SAM enzyme
MFVQYSGEVRPCCVITDAYGDLTRESIDDVWNGPAFNALRVALETDDPPPACVTCPLYGWVPVDAPRGEAGPPDE